MLLTFGGAAASECRVVTGRERRRGREPEEQERRQRIHFHHLDGVRSCAALWVVLEHYATASLELDA
jgi:hypothetical protein